MKMGYDVFLSERVRELIDEGTLSQVVQLIETDLRDSWARTTPQDTESRESLYHQLHALGLFKIRLETLINDLRFNGDY